MWPAGMDQTSEESVAEQVYRRRLVLFSPQAPETEGNAMEQFFKLKGHGTTVRTELVAGLTTFMAMA